MAGSDRWDVVAEVRCDVGEGPLWDAAAQCLWWVDIPARTVHRLDPASRQTRRYDVGVMVGALALRETGGLVLAAQGGFYAWKPSSAPLTLLAALDAGDTTRRLNDGTCDGQGRFWAGAMEVGAAPGEGVLWSFEPDGSVVRRLSDLTIPNGIDWSPGGDAMYLVDSTTHRVDVLDVTADGEPSNRRPFATLPGSVLPDGLTVDAEGGVWVALWGGWGIHHYAPDGLLVEHLQLPVAQVTSCAFGGPDLTDLFVTTAAGGLGARELSDQPLAGAVFRFPAVGVGRPPRLCRG